MSEQITKGINFSDALALIFIYLKLTNQINLNWIWVTCPFWGGLIIGIILIMIKNRL